MADSLLATLSSMYGMPSVDTAVCPTPMNSKLKKKIPSTAVRICEWASCSSKILSSHAKNIHRIYQFAICTNEKECEGQFNVTVAAEGGAVRIGNMA